MITRTIFSYLDASFDFLPDIDLNAMVEGTLLAPRAPHTPIAEAGPVNIRFMETCILHVLGFSIMETAAHCLAQGLGGAAIHLFDTYNIIEGFKTGAALALKWLTGRHVQIRRIHISRRDLAGFRTLTNRYIPVHPANLVRMPIAPEFEESRVVFWMTHTIARGKADGASLEGADRRQLRSRRPLSWGRTSPSPNLGRSGPDAGEAIRLRSVPHRLRQAA